MTLSQRCVRPLLRLLAVAALLLPLPALAHGFGGHAQQHDADRELLTKLGYGIIEIDDCLRGVHPPVHLHCHHAHDGRVLAGNSTTPDREEPDAAPAAVTAETRLFIDEPLVVPLYHPPLLAVQPSFILFGNFRS